MSALFPWAAPTPLPKSRTSPITEGGSSLQWQYDKDRTQNAGTGNTIMHSLEKLYHSTMHGRNQLMMQGFHGCLTIPERKGRGGKKSTLCTPSTSKRWPLNESLHNTRGQSPEFTASQMLPHFSFSVFPPLKKKSLTVLRRHLSKSHFFSG